jgi:antitoxin ParD1/3/4
MNVSLTPELERFVNEKVETGLYQTASEVVREGLRLLKQREEERLHALRRDVRAGFASIDRGQYEEHDEQSTQHLAGDIKARGRARLSSKGRSR